MVCVLQAEGGSVNGILQNEWKKKGTGLVLLTREIICYIRMNWGEFMTGFANKNSLNIYIYHEKYLKNRNILINLIKA